MHTFDLIRHAESKWVEHADASPVPLFGGRMNEVGLSDKGPLQSRRLGEYAHRNGIVPAGFHSSPATRALQTHRLSADAMGRSDEAIVDERLQELDWGSWTGQPRSLKDAPATKRLREQLGFNFAPPGGESFYMVRDRAWQALLSIVESRPSGLYWVHTHRNVIKALVAPYFGWSVEETAEVPLDVVSITRLAFSGGQLDLIFFNQPTL